MRSKVFFVLIIVLLLNCSKNLVDVTPSRYGTIKKSDSFYIKSVRVHPESYEIYISEQYCKAVIFELVNRNINISSYLTNTNENILSNYFIEIDIYVSEGDLINDIESSYMVFLTIYDSKLKNNIYQVNMLGYSDIKMSSIQKKAAMDIANIIDKTLVE